MLLNPSFHEPKGRLVQRIVGKASVDSLLLKDFDILGPPPKKKKNRGRNNQRRKTTRLGKDVKLFFSRKGFCRNPRGILPNKVPGEFCGGFFWSIFLGLFPWKK